MAVAWSSDTLCTSGFVDDVMFSRNVYSLRRVTWMPKVRLHQSQLTLTIS